MSGAIKEEVFDVSAEKYYKALLDYKSYPKLLAEVDNIDVLEFSDKGAKIQYHINLVKKLSYILQMTHTKNKKVAWHLDSGSLFKKNEGAWTLTDIGKDQVKVHYELDVAVKIFAPKAITNKLVAVNLPRMMKIFYEHAKTL